MKILNIQLRFPTITRVCLERKLKEIFPTLKKGKVLYIGVETNIYKDMIPHKEFLTLDIDKRLNPDIIGDIHKINLNNEKFDSVIALHILEYCKNPQKAIDECYRVLKKNGTIILSAPFLYPYYGIKGKNVPKDRYRFTPFGIKELTKKYKNTKIISMGNKFLTLWQIMSKGRLSFIFHVFNPLLAYFDFIKKTRFALNYLIIIKKN